MPVFFFSLAPGAALAASIKLAWDANPESDISGYGVAYRSEDGHHRGMVMVGRTTEATVSRLRGGQRYTLYVVAYNNVGLSSGPSAEVSGVAEPVRTKIRCRFPPTARSRISRKARRASSRIASHY